MQYKMCEAQILDNKFLTNIISDILTKYQTNSPTYPSMFHPQLHAEVTKQR